MSHAKTEGARALLLKNVAWMVDATGASEGPWDVAVQGGIITAIDRTLSATAEQTVLDCNI